MNTQKSIADRKKEHLDVCQSGEAYFANSQNSLDQIQLIYEALPDLDYHKIDMRSVFLNKQISLPVLVGSMTGGCHEAIAINQKLAFFCQENNLPLALGSCRAYLKSKDFAPSFELKKYAPQLPILLGNIGAVQLNYGVGTAELDYLVEKLQLDGLIFHLNPLQEAIQQEGDKNFAELTFKLGEACTYLKKQGLPVFIKEVGAGIGPQTALKLSQINPDFIEVAGQGGTSWAYIEGKRSTESISQSLGNTFKNFGESTLQSLKNIQKVNFRGGIIASGGVRNGIDIAKCIASKSDLTAMAQPFLKAAYQDLGNNHWDSLRQFYMQTTEELRMVCFLTGAHNLKSLREQQPIRTFNS